MPRRNRRLTARPHAYTDGRQRPKRAPHIVRPHASGTCEDCGKAKYGSEHAAAAAARLLTPPPGLTVAAYRCPVDRSVWHVGSTLHKSRRAA